MTTINISLIPISTSHLVIKTINATNGSALPNTHVLIQDSTGATYQEITTDNYGEYSYCDFVPGKYNFYGGKWGRITALVAKTVSTVQDTVIIATAKGYYDDFIMDYGWTKSQTSSSGTWVRGVPVGTTYNTTNDCNPGLDVSGDFGSDCYVTGNGGGNAGDDDVDNGNTILYSPIFDLSTYTDPYLSYYHWFFNDGGQGNTPNDSLNVWLYNGIDSALIDMADKDSIQSQWVHKNTRVSNYLSATATMRIVFKNADTNPGHLVEAAVDLFEVVDSAATGITNISASNIMLKAIPNPFCNEILIQVNNLTGDNALLEITDALGQTIYTEKINSANPTIQFNGKLSSGIYFLKLTQNNKFLKALKLIRTN